LSAACEGAASVSSVATTTHHAARVRHRTAPRNRPRRGKARRETERPSSARLLLRSRLAATLRAPGPRRRPRGRAALGSRGGRRGGALRRGRELAALGRGRPDGLGPFFHAFPLRLDPGAPYERRLDELADLGAEWSTPADPLFGDRFLTRASPTVGPEAGEAFRQAIRALNPTALGVTQRLLRSFPRPYVDIGAVHA